MAWPGGWLCTHSQSVVLNFDTFDVYRQDRQGCRASCQGFLQGGAGVAQCGDSDKPLELHLFAGTLPDVFPASNTGMTSFLFTGYAFRRAGVASSATALIGEGHLFVIPCGTSQSLACRPARHIQADQGT